MAGSNRIWLSFVLLISFLLLSQHLQIHAANEGFDQASRMRGVEHIGDVHEIHCSRERSRVAWTIIEEYLMPFVKKQKFQLSKSCRIHEDNDLYRDQERHKIHRDFNEWECGYCKKTFSEEKYLDKHFDNRHYNVLNTNGSRCLADICGALHCDSLMEKASPKKKCNPAAVAKNKHLCEGLANSCFPVTNGTVAIKVHDFFLRQFCDALTCSGNLKPFSKGFKKGRSWLYIVTSVVVLVVLVLFYTLLYMIKSGMPTKTKWLRRISDRRLDKKSH